MLLDMAAQLRAHLMLQRACVEPEAFASVLQRLDSTLARVGRMQSATQRSQFLARRLETIVDQASALPVRRRRSVTDESSDDTDADDRETLNSHAEPADAESRRRETPAPVPERRPRIVLASHQWVPPTLFRIYESIEGAAASDNERQRPREALQAAMQQLLEHMRETKPFSHLHIIYRPPPPPQSVRVAPLSDGHAAPETQPAAPTRYEIRATETLTRITKSLTRDVAELHKLAFWLEGPAMEPFETSVREFETFVALLGRTSIHVHYVLLYLYSVAMDRADPHASVHSIARDVTAHTARLHAARDAYNVSRSARALSDPLVRQTAAHFPEVLVYVDASQREDARRDAAPYGFASVCDALAWHVDLDRVERKDQRTLAHLAESLKDVFHAWRKSRLGTDAFERMTIQDLGALELAMKTKLRTIVDLLYQQNVVAWMLRQWCQPSSAILNAPAISAASARSRSPSPLAKAPTPKAPVAASPGSDDTPVAAMDTAAAAPANERPSPVPQRLQPKRVDERFRPPGVLKMQRNASRAKRPASAAATPSRQQDKSKSTGASGSSESANPLECTSTLRYAGPVLLSDICAWTDEEIDAHEQEKEQIYELQQQLQGLRDKMSLETISRAVAERIDVQSLPTHLKYVRRSVILLETWRRVHILARSAVCAAETIALHGAAEALIQRPSIRDECNDASVDAKTTAHVPVDAEAGAPDAEDDAASVRALTETIGASRHAIAAMLTQYCGEQTSEWRNHLVFFANASRDLLTLAHDRVAHGGSAVGDEEQPCEQS